MNKQLPVCFAERNQLPVEAGQLVIRHNHIRVPVQPKRVRTLIFKLVVGPQERLPHIRVIAAPHAHLVPVPDMRGTGPGELLYENQFLDCPCSCIRAIHLKIRISTGVLVIFIERRVVDACADSRRVMTGSKIHHGIPEAIRDPRHDGIQVRHIPGCAQIRGRLCEETARWHVPSVIHHRIKYISLNPGDRIGHPVRP